MMNKNPEYFKLNIEDSEDNQDEEDEEIVIIVISASGSIFLALLFITLVTYIVIKK